MSRKELQEQYKNRKARIGVFQIRNLSSGRIFVDGSMDLDKIWNRHFTQLKFRGHPNKDLQADWDAMGESQFVFEILSEVSEPEDGNTDLRRELRKLTELFLEDLAPYPPKGYNIRKTGV